ncbi:hypothetical protein JTE90_014425 [Oedothorax gibbosus]|uniref:Uncharacterized protein n=1 Tax=Oedothorax gibbosus TaxID=931172 RepID=A0AAV6V1A2_9ARAC|nr:hypothetical protein JTE90_014425 [Oedothorax gibbosus]
MLGLNSLMSVAPLKSSITKNTPCDFVIKMKKRFICKRTWRRGVSKQINSSLSRTADVRSHRNKETFD